jgi:hypothetical protein
VKYLVLLVFLCGCMPKTVLVPTPVPCVVPATPAVPHWAIEDLTGKETYGEILRAFGASLEAERGYSQELEIILDGMR